MNRQLELFSADLMDDAIQTTCAPPVPAPDEQERRQRMLHADLEARTRIAINLVITDNKSTMMSLRHRPDGTKAQVRLHRMFLVAPQEVRNALAHWIKHPRTRKHDTLFRQYIAAQRHTIKRTPPQKLRLITQGNHHDLDAMMRVLNQDHFDNKIDVAISWGRDNGKALRSIRFGAYYAEDRLIRIHPRLDQSFVPAHVVRYIVYHEMLHARIGITRGRDGRCHLHPPAFKKAEKRYPEYDRAVTWLEDPANLRRILRRPRQ